MSKRDAILKSAILLFNEQGTGPVSTNHIAADAGVSPGNLYYHFSNKEAIIRSLFDQMSERWATELNLPADRRPTSADVDALLAITFGLIEEYRFFYREPVTLVKADGGLADRYSVLRKRGQQGFAELYRALAAGTVLRPATEIEIQRSADLCWMVTEFWLQNLELEGAAGEIQAVRGIELVRHLLGLPPS